MSEVQVAPDAAKPNHYGEKLWFGHPPQLAWLFSTELWERFGYYGMRALLAIYLAGWFFSTMRQSVVCTGLSRAWCI
ncbi:hypothetical protein [Hankyongella ginsenosidimutans]|uniref:hypothetical protein n=1 Tax=Hankyongella ginsenosidimutans TaxID=1763828 RepID=UPI001CA36CB1|nr:hypothetical protein [Hankyongella ginsenosidimutans]